MWSYQHLWQRQPQGVECAIRISLFNNLRTYRLTHHLHPVTNILNLGAAAESCPLSEGVVQALACHLWRERDHMSVLDSQVLAKSATALSGGLPSPGYAKLNPLTSTAG
jgi:hypothetical protein